MTDSTPDEPQLPEHLKAVFGGAVRSDGFASPDGQTDFDSAGKGHQADSAGTAWKGRELKPNPFAGDTGEADPQVTAALNNATANPFDPTAHIGVVEALKDSRVYAPILPEALSKSVGEHGLMVDNSSDMAMVRLSSEDGREATPCFTAIPLLTQWGTQARPVPIEAERLGLGAVDEGSQLVIIDPGSDHAFLLRRPALWAFVQGHAWTPSWADREVAQAIGEAAAQFPWIASVGAGPGSRRIVTGGPELAIILTLEGEPDFSAFHARLAEHPVIVDRVDSLTITVR
ncbi:SseB family protein [Brevibacterium sp. Marseille-P9724]|uniref:SseB family protein n=1 Tax=Brevibacterium sp. Marseille-P9724 TaxID=2614125 RepID=UPI00125FE6A3|nr:SseB family protein [Brevibacterium sp. Marseille-P9724]